MREQALLRVVKLGGSLLSWPAWPGALQRWFSTQPAAINLLVVGGGRWVERLRGLDRQLELPAVASHWLAIGLMSVTARRVVANLPGGRLRADPLTGQQLRIEEHREGVTVLDPWLWLQEGAAWRDASPSLPASWDVTSDSIAAWLAVGITADELVLLKSIRPPGDDPTEWCRTGLVDAYFPVACAAVPCVRVEQLTTR